jgi:membrane protein YqaA with SNARE-associated domain
MVNDNVTAPLITTRVMVRLIIGGIVLLSVTGLLGAWVRQPLTELASEAVQGLGLLGLFFGVMFFDSSPLPLITEPLLFVAYAGGLDFMTVVVVAGTASFLAGAVGYAGGAFVGRLSFVARWLERVGLAPVMRRRGVLVVATTAVTPLPFAASTWTAGACKVAFIPFVGVCLLRYLKVSFYLGLIVLGWTV